MNVESEAAAFGTRHHTAVAARFDPERFEVEGGIEDDLVDSAEKFLKIHSESASRTYVELPITIFDGLGGTLMEGTCDFLALWESPDGVITRGHVIDLKFGWRGPSSKTVFLQLGAYYAGITVAPVPITVSYYMPRTGATDTYTFQPQDREKVVSLIADVIAKTEDPDAPLCADPEACEFCPCTSFCPAFRQEVNQLSTVNPSQVAVQDLSRYIWLGNLIANTVLPELKRQAKEILAHGGSIPGLRLTTQRGHRAVKSENLVDLANVIHEYLSAEELLSLGKFPFTRVLDTLKRAIHAKEGGTLKASEEKALTMLGPHIAQGADIQKLVSE